MHLMYAVGGIVLQLVLGLFPTNKKPIQNSPKNQSFLNFTHTKMYTLLGF